ncbi:MAG: zinc ribbon domain-containing protein [candidate division Zixibacteria bacterium]|nr:zinc ribbon domain-containing protein [candidate division Zixibacteria bacterium]
MPIYEYRCGKCSHKFDALQKVGEDGTGLKCPKCGTDNPTKILSVFSSSDSSGKSSSSCSTSKGFS